MGGWRVEVGGWLSHVGFVWIDVKVRKASVVGPSPHTNSILSGVWAPQGWENCVSLLFSESCLAGTMKEGKKSVGLTTIFQIKPSSFSSLFILKCFILSLLFPPQSHPKTKGIGLSFFWCGKPISESLWTWASTSNYMQPNTSNMKFRIGVNGVRLSLQISFFPYYYNQPNAPVIGSIITKALPSTESWS